MSNLNKPMPVDQAAKLLVKKFKIPKNQVRTVGTKLRRHLGKGVQPTLYEVETLSKTELFTYLCERSNDRAIRDLPAQRAEAIERGREIPGEIWATEEPDDLPGKTFWTTELLHAEMTLHLLNVIYKKVTGAEFDAKRFEEDLRTWQQAQYVFEADAQIPAHLFTNVPEDQIHEERANEKAKLDLDLHTIRTGDYRKQTGNPK